MELSKSVKKRDQNLSVIPPPEITYCYFLRSILLFFFVFFISIFDVFSLVTVLYNIHHLVLWFFHLTIDCKLMSLSLLQKINT